MSYPALPLPEARSFRVMHLWAGTADEPIRFSLQLTTCEANPPIHYEALSYAWGDLTLTHEIFCEGTELGASRSLMVTTNCYNALRSLRQPQKMRTLWIDAICINQKDLEERGTQVANMWSIYRGASQVVVYLGEGGDDSDSLMKFIDDWWLPHEFPRNHNIPSPNEKAWKRFCTRPWFARMWVLQEVINAKEVELRCGGTSIPWAAFDHYCQHYGWWKDREKLGTPVAHQVLRYIRNLERSKKDKEGARLLQLLNLTRRCLSSDPRDKLYGLLPILRPHGDTPLNPDYHQPTTHVFTNLALHLYTVCGPDVLRYASKTRREDGLKTLPTWVPDWTCVGVYGLTVTANVRNKRFKAGGEFSREIQPCPSVLSNGFLQIQALYISSLGTLSDECDLDKNHFPLTQWRKIALGSTAVGTYFANLRHEEAHPEEAFQRLLTYDQITYFHAVCDGLNAIIDWETKKLLDVRIKDKLIEGVPPSYGVQRRRILDSCDKRKLGVLQNGFLALLPVHAELGDFMYVLPGTSVPFLFRRQGGHYIFVGECYVQGIMYGEAWSEASTDSLETLTVE